jgi:hypothetical protein
MGARFLFQNAMAWVLAGRGSSLAASLPHGVLRTKGNCSEGNSSRSRVAGTILLGGSWQVLGGGSIGRLHRGVKPKKPREPRGRFASDSPARVGLAAEGAPPVAARGAAHGGPAAPPHARRRSRPRPGAATGPHRAPGSPSSAQPRGARTSGGRGGGAGPGRARSGRRALRLSRLPLTRPGVSPRRLRSGPDKPSPARVRVRPPGSPCLGWRGPLSRPAALGSPSGPASIEAARTGGREGSVSRGPGFRGGAWRGGGEGAFAKRCLGGTTPPPPGSRRRSSRSCRERRRTARARHAPARAGRGSWSAAVSCALVGGGPGLRAHCGLASPSSRPCPGREAWRASGRA